MTTSQTDDAKIRETAYLFWLDEGQPEGRDKEHWLKAIDALNPPNAKKPAKKAAAKPKATKPAAATKKPRDATRKKKADA